MCLSEVALYSFCADGTVLGCIGICEAGPCGIVTCFDGGQTGGFDWKACCGMEVVDKGSDMLGRSPALRAVGAKGRTCCEMPSCERRENH